MIFNIALNFFFSILFFSDWPLALLLDYGPAAAASSSSCARVVDFAKSAHTPPFCDDSIPFYFKKFEWLLVVSLSMWRLNSLLNVFYFDNFGVLRLLLVPIAKNYS